MWSDWLVFCDCGFQTVCPLMEKDERLTVAFWWERLTEGETGSCSDGQGHALKSLIQSSVDGWSCVPSLLFTWCQTAVEVMEIMETSFKDPTRALLHSLPPTLQQATSAPRLCWRLLDTHGQVWVSPVGSLLLPSGSWCTRGPVFAL